MADYQTLARALATKKLGGVFPFRDGFDEAAVRRKLAPVLCEVQNTSFLCPAGVNLALLLKDLAYAPVTVALREHDPSKIRAIDFREHPASLHKFVLGWFCRPEDVTVLRLETAIRTGIVDLAQRYGLYWEDWLEFGWVGHEDRQALVQRIGNLPFAQTGFERKKEEISFFLSGRKVLFGREPGAMPFDMTAVLGDIPRRFISSPQAQVERLVAIITRESSTAFWVRLLRNEMSIGAQLNIQLGEYESGLAAIEAGILTALTPDDLQPSRSS
ncbi:MAG: hypothetical protein WC901_05885 [Candidatus Margulisiibacteriota bacterium]